MTKNTYTKETKDNILKRLQPPENKSVSEICKEENIHKSTLYAWIAKARKEGAMIPNSNPSNELKWRTEDKLRIVVETYSLNEEELGQYCRRHGLYASDVKRWSDALGSSLDGGRPLKEIEFELKAGKETIKKLEKELRYKDKALAETAALLVLKKKADAIWGDLEEE